jgi:cullin 1
VVKATFGKKIYDLTMVTVQAVVLLAFNSDSSVFASSSSSSASAPQIVAYTALLEELNVPDDILKRVLHSLSCGKFKILRRISADKPTSSSSASAEKEDRGAIKNTDSFSVNEGFSCPMRKVRIPMATLEVTLMVQLITVGR